jgi:hypothetical protein
MSDERSDTLAFARIANVSFIAQTFDSRPDYRRSSIGIFRNDIKCRTYYSLEGVFYDPDQNERFAQSPAGG